MSAICRLRLTLAPVLAGGLAVGDGNDEERLAELVGAGGADKERLENLLVQSGTERGQAAELDLLNKLDGLLVAGDVVALDVGVEEADLKTVGVEETTGLGDLAEDARVSNEPAQSLTT